jgi:hypothetical protein
MSTGQIGLGGEELDQAVKPTVTQFQRSPHPAGHRDASSGGGGKAKDRLAECRDVLAGAKSHAAGIEIAGANDRSADGTGFIRGHQPGGGLITESGRMASVDLPMGIGAVHRTVVVVQILDIRLGDHALGTCVFVPGLHRTFHWKQRVNRYPAIGERANRRRTLAGGGKSMECISGKNRVFCVPDVQPQVSQ